MKIVHALPPNFADIVAGFPMATKPGVIFAYGNTIYNAGGGVLGPELLAHEAVHGERQGADVEGWWRRYIAEPSFRLEEEIPAHRAEFKVLCQRPGIDKPCMGFRSARIFYLSRLAQRLASPLYGNMISVADAKEIISFAQA